MKKQKNITIDSIDERIDRVRHYMKSRRLDFYMVFTSDAHLSEYISPSDKFREYLTGFTGSAGCLVISQGDAALWVDGRYFIQADEETRGSWIRVMKSGESGVPTIAEYLKAKCRELTDAVIGMDGRYVSRSYLETLKGKLPENASIDCNSLICEKIWPQRESKVFGKIRQVDIKHSGRSTQDKLSSLRNLILKNYCGESDDYSYVVSDLCSVMWLCNLRGCDISYVPVAFSYMLINRKNAYLYVNKGSIDDGVIKSLLMDGIEVRGYSDFYDDILKLRDSNLLIDKSKNNALIFDFAEGNNRVSEVSDSILIRKDIKNATEIEYLENYHLKDGAAVIKFLIELTERVAAGEKITEYEAAMLMDDKRREIEGFIDLSFETISAYGKNAALPHYSADEKNSAPLENKGMYLVDCGGHYPSCTTDITRTIALGEVSEEEKKYYTAVLKGNLDLMDAVFINGTRGENLDILARSPIWNLGVDFKHGTGHGIGCELSVHEAPLAIRYRIDKDNIQPLLEPGMVVSDEPGVYFEGKYGIRLENELLIVKKEENEWGMFMGFKPLTLVPFDRKLILKDELNARQIELLNEYHRIVYEKISPLLDEKEKMWLLDGTKPV